MDIKEKARAYAEGKSNCFFNKVVEDADTDGYKDGYSDGFARGKEIISSSKDNGISYIDFYLPSGTKWSSGYIKDENGLIKYLTYEEASKLNIPTKEQFEELMDCCDLQYKYNFFKELVGYEIKGAGEQYIIFNLEYIFAGGKFLENDKISFWLRDDSEDDEKMCTSNTVVRKMCKHFSLPIMLVS